MQRIIFLILLLLSSMQMSATDIAPVSAAFKAGNASALAAMFDSEVDVAIPGSTKTCSSREAVEALNAFFSAGKPSGFTVVHNADKKDSGFIVGKLATPKGEFRVNISYRVEGNKAIIQSVRIE
ncbi:MAG: DUF4783 domain-containing protein [Tannerellaceae bacterium]|nr:DUF4783 domain-containing protein [Tannerellaceae bacterium]